MIPARVVIPWRGGCPYREANLGHVLNWWATNHPQWPVTLGVPDTDGPWCKAHAIHQAGPFGDALVIVVADADVICPDVAEAVAAVTKSGSWAVPHRTVCRMTYTATAATVADGAPLPDLRAGRRALAGHVIEAYTGTPGGGITAIHSRVLDDVPMDPRFVGWGQEDQAWSLALSRLAGAPWRGQGTLWHLWHPPQQRVTRGVGSPENLALLNRYKAAVIPTLMSSLVGEAREILASQPAVTT